MSAEERTRVIGSGDLVVHRMSELATDFLAGLTSDQRSRAALIPLTDPAVDQERQRWYYTPTDHGGIAVAEMTPRQQSLAMQLLATGVSRAAYATICVVIGMENVLDELEGWHVDWGRKRGRDPGLYWLRIFGSPGESDWAWRFGGHHVSVNITIRNHRIASTTPFFLGIDPARSPLLGGELRPLGATEDLARELMMSLDADQRAQALLHHTAISDIVSGNRPRIRTGDRMMHMPNLFRGSFTEPRLVELVNRIDERAEHATGYTDDDHRRLALDGGTRGLCAGDMDSGQRELLSRLIAVFTDRAPADLARAHRHRYERGGLDDIRFTWAGDIAPRRAHYYRLAGPYLLAEYDNTQRDANHAHSVWRDPTNDFGLPALPQRQ
ncbi:DUF3500 domain-containing protein [Nocardia sp. NPDC050697]|uniref:DUF3500 domain-containing protein n=1 Tax=Nocardia sp. NPDC050697 TaxID=3155158 RepID=UPI0033E0C3D4